ncbi:MAG: RnfH family protein [Ramlibacter sp.]
MPRVVLIHSPGPLQVVEMALDLPVGATVADALQAAGLRVPDGGAVGLWGRPAPLSRPLREGDRVEIARALHVDPKVARRERFRNQGSRAVGLFSGRRPGAKAGY